MKRIICALSLLAITFTTIAQVTTETEYNYIKKGITTTLEQGLDVKKGYYLETAADNLAIGNAVLSAKILFRTADSTTAGTWVKIVVTGTFSGNGTFYYCIPNPDLENGETSYGWTQFYTDLTASGNTAKDAFLRWTAYE